MEQPSTNILGFLLMFLVLVQHPLSTSTAQELDNESEFDYNEEGPIGPSNWGDINKPLWAACKNGTLQSPTHISNLRVNRARRLSSQFTTNYRPSTATLRNRGHDLSIRWDIGRAGFIQIYGTRYYLRQLHWHYPSEHAIDGWRYAMELHLFHVSLEREVDCRVAVIGILYQFGLPDPFLNQLTRDLQAVASQNLTKRTLAVIDQTEVGLYRENYYRYMGSLIVPDCSEGVIWTIKQRVRTVSRHQLTLLREAVHDSAANNARPLQQLNYRDITLYHGII